MRIRLKFIRCWDTFLLKLFLTIGTRMFGYVVTWAPEDRKQVKAIHFAVSEREFNTSVRTIVDRLDSSGHQEGGTAKRFDFFTPAHR